ncbi:hypothetical protein FA13DRAFT_596837 [Coprinellus micaceus]|uniref:Uncharacterized protein n=1 Tax=Coprinellus micaceus TaxID=71717 RepID=A0A4Y7T6S2_COPMI|nr:hypothetical protein FA13DRAFT_596837 [Coprinellus micaceus]
MTPGIRSEGNIDQLSPDFITELWPPQYTFAIISPRSRKVRYIWSGNRTLAKVLYVHLRYLTLIFTGVAELESMSLSCALSGGTMDFGFLALMNVEAFVRAYLQHGIFVLCVYGLFGATKTSKVACIAIYVINATISFTLMVNHVIQNGHPAAGRTETMTVYRIVANYWVFARNTGILLLGAFALYRRYHADQVPRSDTRGRRSLIFIIRRDGLVCYVGLLATTLCTCIFFIPGFPATVRTIAYSGSLDRVVGAILANRLVINLQKSATGQESQMDSLSAVQFADNPDYTRSDVTQEALRESGDRNSRVGGTA